MNVKKEAKFNALLQASIELILEKGFQKMSVSDIVKRAGVAQGTFYIYFPTKNDIVPAVAEHILEQLLSQIKSTTVASHSFWDKVHTIIDATFDMTSHYKEAILLCYSGLAYHHSFLQWEKIYDPYYVWFAEQIRSAQQTGEVNQDIVVTDRLVRMIINMVEQTAEMYFFVDVQQEQHGEKISTEQSSSTGMEHQLKQELFDFISRSLSSLNSRN
ncbi:TetR family transcriptional regulator [Paenibacillus sp. 481]|uniref:TetR family transcriptional regulator n=1 Tax=Paenibacillus sp. 481 TaxID=2835869 RepID=UPI001E340733|nr:TetR family transcriptional regulator [Paenibacillus sp. 481]UHA75182.1 TetR family transcriptional regulator [Paenibacillus sp. 481]